MKWFKKKSHITEDLSLKIDLHFEELHQRLNQIDSKLGNIEKRMDLKDHRDKQSLGQIHYRLEELRTQLIPRKSDKTTEH